MKHSKDLWFSILSHSQVGLISVIHLKDEIVTQSSHIIQQYIKTAGVPIYSLQVSDVTFIILNCLNKSFKSLES